MIMEKRFGALSSSVNPQELATSIQGIIKLVGGLLVAFGVISMPYLEELLGQFGVFVPLLFSLYGTCEAMFGLLRKMVVRFADRQN